MVYIGQHLAEEGFVFGFANTQASLCHKVAEGQRLGQLFLLVQQMGLDLLLHDF